MLKVSDDKNIKLTFATAGSDKVELTQTKEINQIYKGSIFDRKKYVFDTAVKIVIDKTFLQSNLRKQSRISGKRKQTRRWISQVQPWMKI